MSESSSEKRHPATASKLRKARERGEVPHSPATVAAAAAFAGCLAALGSGGYLIACVGRLVVAMTDLAMLPPNPAVPQMAMWQVGREVLVALLPVLVLPAVGALLAAYWIAGPVASMEPLVPRWQRLNPLNTLKQMLGPDGLFRVAHGAACIVLMLGVAAVAALITVDDAIRLWSATPSATLRALAGWSVGLVLAGAFVLLIAGLPDVLFRIWRFRVVQRMTDDELRRDHREQDGDPEIRGRRRARHRELAG